jgi:predicted amidohydrolase YtcJ
MKGAETEVIDAQAAYLVPGLVDPHIHQMAFLREFNGLRRCELVHGSTALALGFRFRTPFY